jgi:hypothetical protein
MKSPPRQVSDSVARQLTEEFIAGVGANGGSTSNGRAAQHATEPAPVPAPPAAG